MRLALLALLLCAFAAAPVHAADCAWSVYSNISPPDQQMNNDSGSSWNSAWTWQYTLYADHLTIFGSMSSYAYHCTTNLAAAAAGNGNFTVVRVIACCHPQEDIEGDARNAFRARAEINSSNYARGTGSLRIKGSKMTLDCHCSGGVEATSTGYGEGTSGTLTLPLFPGGPSIVIHWAKGSVVEKVFQASDGGTGGRTPEVITCQTSVDTSMSVGWWDEQGIVLINDSKSELKVWGTCCGCCQKVQRVLDISVGY